MGGMALTNEDVTFDISEPLAELKSSASIDTQPITIVPSKMEYKLGRSIQVCKDFICYAVRGGKIRVIGQVQGEMILLREHTMAVLDLDLLQEQEHHAKLVSTSSDDTVGIWHLSLGKEEILSQLVFTLHGYKKSNEDESSFKRVFWNAHDSNQMAIVGREYVYLIHLSLVLSNSSEIDLKDDESIAGMMKLCPSKMV